VLQLVNAGLIKGVHVRRPGTTRGRVLLVKASLTEYLYGLADKEAALRLEGK
jgi:hypothetical protein